MFLEKQASSQQLASSIIQKDPMGILVCDDDKIFALRLAESLKKIIRPSIPNARIDCIQDPLSLSKDALSNYDIAFLDIDMGVLSGLDLARRLREVRNDTVLIFVTNFIEYSLEGYEVQAFRYLLKSDLEQKLEKYVQQAILAYQQRHHTICINSEGEYIDIPLHSLVYVETDIRHLILHLKGFQRDSLRVRMTMGAFSDILAPRGFLRVHNSYLVNMEYIIKLQSTKVELTNGIMLPVSSHNYADIRSKYLRWKGSERWSIG